MFVCFLILNVLLQILGRFTRGIVPPCGLSHAVQEICHRLLILLIGGEAVSEPSGNLAVALGSGREVATLSEDLLSVGVVCFVHGPNMAQNRAKIKGFCATLWTVTAIPSLRWVPL